MTTTDDDRGRTHFAGDGCVPPHDDPGALAEQYEHDAELVELGERFDDLASVEERLRGDLDRCRATLRARRQERDDLAEQIRFLVAAEETLVSALRPFDRRRKAQE